MRRGFTLVELALVLIVLGALAGSAVPALRGMTAASERADREAVASAVRLARALAVASGVPHAAALEPAGSVRLERFVSGGAEAAIGPDRAVIAPILAREDRVTRVGGSALGGQAALVWFDPDGAPVAFGGDPDGGARAAEAIVVEFASGERLLIEPATGGVR